MSVSDMRIRGGLWILVCLACVFEASGVAQSQEAAPLSPVTVSPPNERKQRSPSQGRPESARRIASTTSRKKKRTQQVSAAAPAPVAPPAVPVLDGSVVAGYRVGEVTTLGPFQGLKVQDTPFTINIISSDLIENTQSYASPDKIIDMLPGVQYTYTANAL